MIILNFALFAAGFVVMHFLAIVGPRPTEQELIAGSSTIIAAFAGTALGFACTMPIIIRYEFNRQFAAFALGCLLYLLVHCFAGIMQYGTTLAVVMYAACALIAAAVGLRYCAGFIAAAKTKQSRV